MTKSCLTNCIRVILTSYYVVRRGILREYSQMKYMKLKILKKGERLEYGARVQRAPTMDAANATAIWPLDVEGAIADSVPARLQLLSECVILAPSSKQYIQLILGS